ncbi:MAG: DUF421 domain-containing protein [Clostridia bacterium]|nr:DUF421 domain-containing protein [Clostridia bacterium]
MLIPFFRTLILYFCIIVAVRLMGKRQVGEMQPGELVVTILVSAVASVPMQDMDIPLAHGLVPVFTLIAAEVLVSALSLKWEPLRRLLSGRPVAVVREGKVDREALKSLRMSLDDLLEDLRLAGVFDLRKVAFAQVETNGRLSVLPTDGGPGPFYLLVADGRPDPKALARLGKTADWLGSVLRAYGAADCREVFLFCADRAGNMIFLRKGE